MAGLRFGQLKVLRRAKDSRNSRITAWLCQCDCGTQWVVRYVNLTNKSTTNCGCVRKKAGELRKHPLSRRWDSMMTRCYNERSKDYPRYGGRGIKVSNRWHLLQNFIEDLWPSFTHGTTLDRINNNGPYSAENCRWASQKEQLDNRRNSQIIKTPWGKMTVASAAARVGISRGTFRSRVISGWTYDELFNPSNAKPMTEWDRRKKLNRRP